MAVITLTAGLRTLTVPISVSPAGQSWSALVYLSSDAEGNTVAATGTEKVTTSTGSVYNIDLPVSVPIGGSYHTWVVVYINGAYWGTYSQTNTVVVITVTGSGGIITWD